MTFNWALLFLLLENTYFLFFSFDFHNCHKKPICFNNGVPKQADALVQSQTDRRFLANSSIITNYFSFCYEKFENQHHHFH